MIKPFVHITNITLNYRTKTVLRDLNWTIKRSENWLLTGSSGSGKTTLAKAIAGLVSAQGDIHFDFNPLSNLPAQVLYVDSWYRFKNVEGVANFYYQQRYTSLQAKETLTLHAELLSYGKAHNLEFADVENLLNKLGLSEFKNSQLIELSSGEHKKLQLIKALWLKPQLLIIDQPYTGLDALSRKNLNNLLDEISTDGVQLILIGNDADLPSCINRFAEIKDGNLIEKYSIETYTTISEFTNRKIPDFLSEAPLTSAQELINLVDVNIRYGEKQVLKNINWKVKAREKWLLQGHNGSGKSTLLSLINADHPQSYANNIYLFGKKRGTGESIWDIKNRIGLISPEFHWYFDVSSTVWQSIASGFFDSVGLFRELGYKKHNQVDELINYFGLGDYKNELLAALPLGKQRLVLLARTIIKNPELLILDEPCQGLDQQQTQHFNQLIDELSGNGMTLIYVGHFESQLPSCIEKRILLENGEVKAVETILESI